MRETKWKWENDDWNESVWLRSSQQRDIHRHRHCQKGTCRMGTHWMFQSRRLHQTLIRTHRTHLILDRSIDNGNCNLGTHTQTHIHWLRTHLLLSCSIAAHESFVSTSTSSSSTLNPQHHHHSVQLRPYSLCLVCVVMKQHQQETSK